VSDLKCSLGSHAASVYNPFRGLLPIKLHTKCQITHKWGHCTMDSMLQNETLLKVKPVTDFDQNAMSRLLEVQVAASRCHVCLFSEIDAVPAHTC